MRTALITLTLLSLLITGCGYSSSPTTTTQSKKPTPTPVLSDEQRQKAIEQILTHPEVLNASVSQLLNPKLFKKGPTLSLVLGVKHDTPYQRATELGEIFLRLVKSLGPDSPPTGEIGKGSINYQIPW
jgi:hypothetical protein